MAGEEGGGGGGGVREERLVNYSRLHPCITFSLSSQMCSKTAKNTIYQNTHFGRPTCLFVYRRSMQDLLMPCAASD